MDTLCKLVVKTLDSISSLVKQKFFAQTVYGLQNFLNAFPRLFSRTTLMIVHHQLESKSVLAPLLMNHLVYLLCFLVQLYTLTACIHEEKAAPSGHGLDGFDNTSQVRVATEQFYPCMTRMTSLYSSLSPFAEIVLNPLTNFLPAGWSAVPEEKASRYRLSIKDVQPQDSGTYTCASPRSLTNSIIIVVAGNS